ncbi:MULTISPECIES: hypothetical protein [Chryseobacterium]|uniref:hypothetical protein n=1 Tax=Chryseobacterium TaxID=59732 RepID=UPI002274BCFA|nr:hypothetical protein [Chryseobacterium sp. SL1]MCY1662520.1 hypothetical protein [Chryseobacterium sp. SL1]
MDKYEYQRLIKPIIDAREKEYILGIGGTGFRSTKSKGEEFFNRYKNSLLSTMEGFYSITNGYSYEWESNIPTNIEGQKISEHGIINIIPLDELFEKPNVVELEEGYNYYIKGEDSFSKTGQFIPVDYIEDICAGVFSKENEDEMVYFHDFGIGFYPLKINFKGYVELAFAARGYLMWQYVLVYLEYGKYDGAMLGKSRYDDFAENMPIIFPDFDMEEFIKLYESLKIK